MRSLSFVLISICFLLPACEKDIHPKAGFTFGFATDYESILTPPSDTANIPRYATYEPIQFENSSSEFKQMIWSFGDGQVTHEQNPVMFYRKGGDYNVILSLLSETGNRSEAIQPIKIYDRVIDEITVNFQGWDHNIDSVEERGWSSDHVSDVVLEIGVFGTEDELIPGTVVYTSDTIPDVSLESPLFSIATEEDIVLDYGLFQDEPPFYVITLSAIDEQGKHIFYSSSLDELTHYLDYKTGLFKVKSGSTIDITCVFK